MNERAQRLGRFLASSEWRTARRQPLAGDASSRRYERLTMPDGRTAILMDAPAEGGHDVGRFVALAQHLSGAGFSPPVPYFADVEAGFAVLEDLGDRLYARVVKADETDEQALYQAAVDVLVALAGAPPAPGLKPLGASEMRDQIAPVFDWYCAGLGMKAGEAQRREIEGELETVLTASLRMPGVMVLRDFHAENLIWLPERQGVRRVGLLDFQDALIGDPAYDLVSLLQDARRDLALGLEAAMKARFCGALGLDGGDFEAGYAAVGLQRNLRILGVFARLCLDHGKTRYVDFLPRVWGHVWRNLRHPDLRGLGELLRPVLPEPTPAGLAKLRTKCVTVQTP
ncbi:MAG: phosphotransferase [Rhodobacter sp.]|nr:phosphotransferase [Rhodobacter sp.]